VNGGEHAWSAEGRILRCRRSETETGIETGRLDLDATPSRADLIPTAFPQVRASLTLAEDAGFEPARACTQPAFQASAIGL
jgi:hypothetical protein